MCLLDNNIEDHVRAGDCDAEKSARVESCGVKKQGFGIRD
jgi:hypothetical protein